MSTPRRLLSIGHSYVVALNRRLVNEMARLGTEDWEVTTVAPSSLHGDLRFMQLERDDREQCHLEAVPVHFSSKIHLMTYGWRLKEILQQGWDLVHAWEEPYILAGGQIAWWMPPLTPLVYSTFQNYTKNYPPPFNWIEQQAMHRASGWLGFSHTVIHALKERSGYAKPHQQIPVGVDVEAFYPCDSSRQQVHHNLGWDEKADQFVIGYLGRLVPEKGLDLLMRVLDQVHAPWRLMLVGTGVMEGQLRAWAERYPDRVRLCTTVKHSEVPQYLNAMDLLVAPSQTKPNWREQFGRMLVEAFACGVPVIGSDSGEIPYVIQDAGIIVGEQDEAGWVAAISRLLESPQERLELANKGLHRANTLYAWSIVAQQHLDFFEELLAQG